MFKYYEKIEECQRKKKEIKDLERALAKKKEELKKTQTSCNHQIVVLLSVEVQYCGWDMNYRENHRCLFCEEKMNQFYKSKRIDASEYKKYYDDEKKMRAIQDIYKNFLKNGKGYAELKKQIEK